MADIILVQPIVGLLDNIKTAPALPLSLLTAAKLVSREFEVKLIDQRLDLNWRETLKKELKKKPMLVGTTAMLGPQVEFARAVGEEVKKINPEIPVVWGGPHASILPEQTIADPTVDVIVKGDGEETFLKLAQAIKKKKLLKRVTGIYFQKDGETVFTGETPFVDLNKMPDLPYELIKVSDYLQRRGKVLALDMETSRGCPFRCRFCYNPFYNQRRWRALRPEIVLERLAFVRKKYGVYGIFFIDDEFFIDLLRARKIVEGLKKMNFSWSVQGVTARSILAMDDGYLKMLESAGCEQLNIGAESGSTRILKMVEKGITPKEILAVNKKLRPYKIMPWYYFMIGFPGETKKEAEMTLDLVLQILRENPRAKVSGIGCFTPYPGTPLFEEAKRRGFLPPKDLLGWSTFSVDQVNIPWITGEKKRMIEAVQFTSFFVDQKARDIVSSFLVRAVTEFYRPFARLRLKRKFFGFPLDIMIGNQIKKKLARERKLL